MLNYFTRRQFLRTSLLLGAGAAMSLPALARLQEATPSPESTPEMEATMTTELTGSIRPVHDPVMIKHNDTYYAFSTGIGIEGIPIRESKDLVDWEHASPGQVFAHIPDWALEAVPGATNIWAPDISFYNGKYHLYYSVSTFGKNRSVIGLVTNTTLDSKEEGYKWEDQGMVTQSSSASNYNAIDPNLIIDADGVPWLAFGSFWSGIKMRRLDFETGKTTNEDKTVYSLAQRPAPPDAIEAPFIIHKNHFYYLFVSFDACCQGINSTYHVMVGRSEAVTGPYVDRDGVEMMKGGGTQVTFPNERWRGPGHCAIVQEESVDYIVYHSYDADNLGQPTLRIEPLVWDAEGWPSISKPS